MIRRGWRYLRGYRLRDVRERPPAGARAGLLVLLGEARDEYLASYTGLSPGATALVPSPHARVKAARFGQVWKR